jgi:hypothetical protein
LTQGYPYLFDLHSLDSLYRNTVFGLKDRGFFDPAKGFKKVGVVFHSCYTDVVDGFKAWLRQAGVADGQITTYDLGCPTAFASPSDIAQAVLKFQQAGVTHVTPIDMVGDLGNFTNVAEQQRFRPRYGFGDDAVIQLTYGGQHANFDNIAGATAITASAAGEDRTPGTTPSAGTVKCNAVLAAAGRPSVYQQDYLAGQACDLVWMFQAAAEHAPALQQAALAAGLRRAGSVEFSFPEGRNDFSGDRVAHAGQYWRAAEFHTTCNCWQLLDHDFHPTYR